MTAKRPTIIHLSWLKREEGEAGGVEKFAHYLKIALLEKGWDVIIIGWNDYPSSGRYENLPNPEKAALLGAWIDSAGFRFRWDLAVSDGYWGIGVTSRPVAPVVHGTWAEFHARMGMRPGLEVQRQGEAFNAPNAFPVACSAASAREVLRHHGRSVSATIYHGIDLAAYRPPDQPHPLRPTYVVIQAAGQNVKKGARLIPEIQRFLGPEYRIEYLDAKIGEEPDAFRRGHLFLHPARHEGNAYACLEALATDLPIVTTKAGIFEDIQANGEGECELGFILPIGATPETFARKINRTVERMAAGELKGRPRAWTERQANMTHFGDSWDTFLRGLL